MCRNPLHRQLHTEGGNMSIEMDMNEVALNEQYCEFEAEKDEFHNNAVDSRQRPWLKDKSSLQIMRDEQAPGREFKLRPLKKYCRRAYIYPEEHEEIYDWGVEAIKTRKIPRPPNGKPNFSYFLQQYIKHLKDQIR